MSAARNQATARGHYLQSMFSHEDAILSSLRQKAREEGVERMQISAYEGGILQFFCHALRVQKAIEIGTLYGYSGLMIARALPTKGRLFTLDQSRKRQDEAQRLMQKDPASHKIQFIHGQALNSLQQLESKGPFDMVFIDADKPAFLDYLHWCNKHLKSGGLLIADNAFLFGAVYGEPNEKEVLPEALPVMKEFNKEIAQSGRYISTLIPTAEGLIVGIKK